MVTHPRTPLTGCSLAQSGSHRWNSLDEASLPLGRCVSTLLCLSVDKKVGLFPRGRKKQGCRFRHRINVWRLHLQTSCLRIVHEWSTLSVLQAQKKKKGEFAGTQRGKQGGRTPGSYSRLAVAGLYVRQWGQHTTTCCVTQGCMRVCNQPAFVLRPPCC